MRPSRYKEYIEGRRAQDRAWGAPILGGQEEEDDPVRRTEKKWSYR